MLIVFQGSTSNHKIRAIYNAFENIGGWQRAIIPFAVDSGVPRQPEGIHQAYTGATNRAVGAWERGRKEMEWWRGQLAEVGKVGEMDVISIGIENVIVPILELPADHVDQRHVEAGLCVIKSHLDENIFSMIPGHMLDPRDVAEARRRGFDKCTVTDITRERTGQCESTDSTPYHTANQVTRVDCLEIAARIAISQYLMKIWSVAK